MLLPFSLLAAVVALLVHEMGGAAQRDPPPGFPPEIFLILAPAVLGMALELRLRLRLAAALGPGPLWRLLFLALPAAAVASWMVLLFHGRWALFLRSRLDLRFESLELLLILAPFLVSEVLGRWSEERIVRVLRLAGYGKLFGFGLARLREVALLLLFGILVLLRDLLTLDDRAAVALVQVAAADYVLVIGFLLVVGVLAPDVFRFIYGAVRFPPGALRDLLHELAGRLSFRFRDVLLWRTGGEITNAAVVGPFRWNRYVVLTDGLATGMDREAVSAVFAHEAGHALRHHGIHLILLLVALPAAALAVAEGTGVLSLAEPDGWTWIVLLFLLAFVLAAMRRVSHRFELEADLFAAQALGGIDPGIRVLRTLAGQHPHMRDKSSLRHPSISRRVSFLLRAATDPAFLRAWKERGRRTVVAGYLLLAALGGVVLFDLWRRTPLDLAAYALFTGRPEAAERWFASPLASARSPADEERLAALQRLVPMASALGRAEDAPRQRMEQIRVLAPRRAHRALELGRVEEAADWLGLAVGVGQARRQVLLLHHYLDALSRRDTRSARRLREALARELDEGRLKDAVLDLDAGA